MCIEFTPHINVPIYIQVGKHEPWSALDGGQGDGLDSLKVGDCRIQGSRQDSNKGIINLFIHCAHPLPSLQASLPLCAILSHLQAICTGAVDMLVPGGFIALEVGQSAETYKSYLQLPIRSV